MKAVKFLIPVLAVLIGLGSLTATKAKADEAKGGMDYAALAAKYDKLAADQDAVIQEHQQMKADTARQNPGKAGARQIEKMDKHCDAIIRDARKLKKDYEAFAAWCHLMAGEQEKK